MAEKILSGPPTREQIEKFKKLSESETRSRLMACLHDESSADGTRLSKKSLDLCLEIIGAIGSHLRISDKRYAIDTGISAIRGVDNNTEIEYQCRIYQYRAGAVEIENKNTDSLVSIIPDHGNGSEVHAVFDCPPSRNNQKMASTIALEIIESAGLIGFIEDESSLLKVIRKIYEQLAKKDLRLSATIALINGNAFSLFWIGNNPAILLKKTDDRYEASLLTKNSEGNLSKGKSGVSGKACGSLDQGDVLVILSKNFLDLKDKYDFNLLIQAFEKRMDLEMYGIGPSLKRTRMFFGRLEQKIIDGPANDSSLLAIRGWP